MFSLVMYNWLCYRDSTFLLWIIIEKFNWIDKKEALLKWNIHIPAIVGPHEWELTDKGQIEPLIEMPAIMNAKKLNTVIWSLGAGIILYGILRLFSEKELRHVLQPIVKNVNLDLVDEISYRSVLIGFPIFTLGALIFAMIWAQIAWTRFWGWDPKEVWALITWLFYAAFLHLRLSVAGKAKNQLGLQLLVLPSLCLT